VAPLTWAYLALAAGLMVHGALLIGLGLRRPARTAGMGLSAVLWLALLVAAAGLVAAVILETRAARPW
jgi:hypothetical protein